MKIAKIIIASVSLFINLINIAASNETSRVGKKKFGETCKWQTTGTECANGLQCSKKYKKCLKKSGQICESGYECLSEKCREGTCKWNNNRKFLLDEKCDFMK